MKTGFPSNIFSELEGVYLADTSALSSPSSPFHSHLAQWAPRYYILNKIPIYLPYSNAGYDIEQWTPTSSSHFSPLSDSSSVLCFLAPKLHLHDLNQSSPLLHRPFPVSFSSMAPCTALPFSRFEWPLFLLSDWVVLRNWTEKWLLFKQKAENPFSSVYKLSAKRSCFLAAPSLLYLYHETRCE